MRVLRAFAAYRRALPAPAAGPVITDAPATEAVEQVRFDRELVDTLEADVLTAIHAVGQSVLEASAEAKAAADDLSSIREGLGALVQGGHGAAAETVALAASTEELATTAGQIDASMNEADGCIGRAVAGARVAGDLITELTRASEEIGSILETILGFARQTNLLALNATIEAARAGPSGRGFSVVASEVKSLSVETSRAASDIRARIERLRATAAASTSGVNRVVEVIEEVRPVFDTVRAAVSEQNESVAELARRASETSAFVEQVREGVLALDRSTTQAMVRVGEAESAVERASVLAAGLSRRFVAVLRHSDIGDRRQADRFPVELSAVIRLGDRSAPTRTVDLSRGGALLCQAEDLPLQSGDQIGLDLESVGPMRAAVVAVSGLGVHCAFREPDELTERRLANRIAEIELEYRPLINATTAGAARIERAMEALVAAGRLTQRDLFDTNYRQIPGTDPIQYETPSTAALEAALTPIQEELLAADRGRIFCIAVDRNGYIPVHNRIYSQPQRPGQTDWNLSYCRNKRIFDDRAGITAARSSRPFVVQAYARQMGGGETVMMREVDVPLKPFGRHWGAFRIAHRF